MRDLDQAGDDRLGKVALAASQASRCAPSPQAIRRLRCNPGISITLIGPHGGCTAMAANHLQPPQRQDRQLCLKAEEPAFLLLAAEQDSSYFTDRMLHPNGGTVVNA